MYTAVAQREIPAAVDRVWAFLSEPPLLARWFADTGPLRPGEPCRFEFGDGDYHAGRVVERVEGVALAFRWSFLDLGPEYDVRFTLLRRKEGTEVSIVDRGALTVEEAECLRVGWHEFLVRLDRSVRHGWNTRFTWRPLISVTARVPDLPRVRAALADPGWYASAFPGVRAVVEGDGGDLTATLSSPAWGGATTDLRIDFRRAGAADYLYAYHGGWSALPARIARRTRRGFVDRWRVRLAELGAR